jgi:hypothetical protein
MSLLGRVCSAASVAVWLWVGLGAEAQEAPGPSGDSGSLEVAPVASRTYSVPLNDARILKIIPDYQTVNDSAHPIAPLTARQKWSLGFREAIDPFNIANAAMTAAFSQHDNQTPRYGEGWANYGKRFGAAVADFGSQSFLSAGLFATLLHQDPRYFRRGPGAGILSRAAYSISRLFVCRNDAGRSVFNASNLLGMSAGIAVSNIYYPSASRTGGIMAGRIETSLLGGFTGNLLSEFWPDLQRKFLHRKPKDSQR